LSVTLGKKPSLTSGKQMKKILVIGAFVFAGVAHAESSVSTAEQTSTSQSVAQGTIQFSQTPEHTTETVRNVSAPVLGAYASSFSQMNCGQTAQGGFAVAGFSGVFGASKDSHTCVLEVAAAEMVRQSTVTADPQEALALRHAANGVRCQVSEEVYNAMQDAGFDCKRKPAGMQ
jgi:hypothetical protein